ncbi:MAG: ureidoglycolate lyase [Chloroflexi bacterium]|nr:ureidoglycolate lyase [Chloroflexota bacterium]
MVKVHKLKIEPMTEESFKPFGEILDAKERPLDHRQFFPINFQADVKTTVSAIWQPREGLTFNLLERHFGTSQSFIQLAGAPAVVAAAAPTDPTDPTAVPNPEDVHGFLIDLSKGFSFYRGTWHSLNRHILAPPGATFVIMGSSPNPTQVVDYEKSFALSYKDLGSDKNPKRVDFKGKWGVIFEFGL